MVIQAKVTRKGQVTIPVEIRRVLRLEAGDRVMFEIVGKEAVMRKMEAVALSKVLDETRGTWNDHPIFGKMSTKGVIEWLRGPEEHRQRSL